MTMIIDKLAWIHLKDKKILSTLSKGKDTYYIPGGKREGTESDSEALKREIKEELSIDLIDETITYFGTFEAQAHGKSEGVVVRMTCYTSEYQGFIMPANEIDHVVWFGYTDREKSSTVDKVIFDYLKDKDLIG